MSKTYTLNDRQIQTIVRTIMPDLYLFQKYSDSYVCEDPEDLEAIYDSAKDEGSSKVTASPEANHSN